MGVAKSIKLLPGLLACGAILLLSFALLQFGGSGAGTRAILQMGVALLLLVWAVLVLIDPRAAPDLLAGGLLVCVTAYGLYRGLSAEVGYLAKSDLAHFGMMIGMLLVLLGCLKDKRWCRWVVIFVVVAATAEALYALVQFATNSTTILGEPKPENYAGRASGTFVNPNHGAWFMCAGLLLALALCVFSREPWAWRIFHGYAVLVCLGGAVVTFSRGAWLGLGVALVFIVGWVVVRTKKLWLGAVLLTVLVLGVGFAFDPLMAVLKHQGRQRATDIRLAALWPAAIKVWREDPWRGVGPGHFPEHYRKHRLGQYGTQNNPVRTHNDYLNVLAEWGVIGIALLLAGLVLLAWRFWARLRTRTDSGGGSGNRLALALGAGTLLVYVFVHAATDFNLYVPANAMVMALVAGLILTPINADRRDGDALRVSSRWWRGVWCGFALTLAATLFLHANDRHRESRALAAALSAPSDFASARRHLETALSIRPDNPDTHYRLGELLRRRSTEGVFGDEAGALQALEALTRAVALSPMQPHYWIAKGRTEHWLDESDAARTSFETALALDPQNYRIQAYYGWYLHEIGDLENSFRWLKRSQWLNYEGNDLAKFYLPRLERRLRELLKWPVKNTFELRQSNPSQR